MTIDIVGFNGFANANKTSLYHLFCFRYSDIFRFAMKNGIFILFSINLPMKFESIKFLSIVAKMSVWNSSK